MQRFVIVTVALVVVAIRVHSQTAPLVGLRDNTPSVHALTDARIVVAPGKVLNRATIVIRNGIIEAVGTDVKPPADARVWNARGSTLYAGFIDLASDYGMVKPATGPAPSGPPQPAVQRGAGHSNVKMFADARAEAEFAPDPRTAEKLRSQGITTVLSHPQRGVFRGTGALISVGDETASRSVTQSNVSQYVALETGGFGSSPPSSLMGVIAFIRQALYDAEWYRASWETHRKRPAVVERPETNTALAALADVVQRRHPVLMTATDEWNVLRAAKIGKEFNLSLWLLGSGREYRRLNAVKATGLPIILPLNFPGTPNVESPEEAMAISLDELTHWDAAPENPGRLASAGVTVALTSAQLKDAGTYLSAVRKAVSRGMKPDQALSALTTTPASLLGMSATLGTLEKGRRANIVITDGDLFEEKTKIREVWVDGKRYEVKVPPSVDPRGTWEVSLNTTPEIKGTWTLKGETEKMSGSATVSGKRISFATVAYSAGRLSVTMPGDSLNLTGALRLSGTVTELEIFGVGETPTGGSFSWKGTRKDKAAETPDTTTPTKPEMASFTEVVPPGEYGRPTIPAQPANVFVRNATIWTSGPQGRIVNADMLVAKGRIVRIGTGLSAPFGAVIIDGTGKHVTPGLIDAHSHTAVNGSVNESGPAITCHVRIADVLDANNIWIYRQLAGGTTAANILHGSANPIGGQNAVVKWRWGALPDELLLEGAPQGVKFALGENVKQSHFFQGGQRSTRYPRTRMAVEQIIRDRFQAAREYERSWKDWERDKSKAPPRRNLEFDALVEIVNGTRLIHAHSYRQDEILMLLRVCEDFGIRIATLQHVLEGYKVADAIARHGAGASGFSDWWAYKHEAYDAIPGAFPLMHQQGVLVSYNSDDSELATRLNREAAKAVPFGIPEEEALAFVTINPAKQLRVDNRVGSLESGKDADFVVWNGPPLSTFTACEQTWVDGRKYFDVQEDAALQDHVAQERAALVQKVLRTKKPGVPSGGPGSPSRRAYEERIQHCDDGMEDH